jgi:hypothetical protein
VVDRAQEGNEVRLSTRAFGQRASLWVGPSRLRLVAGEPLRPESSDVGAPWRERLGPELFGKGHLSAVADVGELRRQITAPLRLPGVTAGRLTGLQVMSSTFLDQVTSIDIVSLDLGPEQGGLRVRGRVAMRGAK